MRRSESAMSRELDGEVVILDVDSGNYFSINDVGALVWDRLEEETDRDTLVKAVTEAFDIDPDTATTDIETLLEQLAEAGLIVNVA